MMSDSVREAFSCFSVQIDIIASKEGIASQRVGVLWAENFC